MYATALPAREAPIPPDAGDSENLRPTKPLTEAEFRIMDGIRDPGPSTVAAVREHLPESLDLAYSNVLTTMRILEEKGWLRHIQEGRTPL